MHVRSGLAIAVVALAFVAAGCGGGSHTSVPAGDHPLQPQLNGGAGSSALPTLYVAGQGAVYAYDLSVTPSPDASPVSKTTGYYYQAGSVNASIAGIATSATGDLVIAQNYASGQGDGNSCQLVWIAARTGTKAANGVSSNCDNEIFNVTGQAVAVTYTGPGTGSTPAPGAFAGDVDVLMHYQRAGNPSANPCATNSPVPIGTPTPSPSPSASPSPTITSQYEVDRYAINNGTGQASAQYCVTLDQGQNPAATYVGIGGSTNGAFFVDYNIGGNGTIERYNGDGNGPTATGSGLPGAGPIAVAVNATTNTGYRVVASTSGNVTTIYNFKVNGNTINFTHTLGTFPNPVTGLAVDNNGNVYVGVDQPNGVTKVKVYTPTQTQATSPSWVLNNPVRRPNPAASPQARITGLAITQP